MRSLLIDLRSLPSSLLLAKYPLLWRSLLTSSLLSTTTVMRTNTLISFTHVPNLVYSRKRTSMLLLLLLRLRTTIALTSSPHCRELLYSCKRPIGSASLLLLRLTSSLLLLVHLILTQLVLHHHHVAAVVCRRRRLIIPSHGRRR